MAYVAPTAASAGVAYTAANMNVIKDDIIWLYNQRVLAGYDYSGTDWSPTAADATYEDDTDTDCTVTVTLVATSTVLAFGMARITSDTARDESVKMRFKGTGGTTNEMGYGGFADANCRISYPLTGAWVHQGAGDFTVVLQAAQAEADDALTIEDRYFCVVVAPE